MRQENQQFQISQDDIKSFLFNNNYNFTILTSKKYQKEITFKIDLDTNRSIFLHSGIVRKTCKVPNGKKMSAALIYTFRKRYVPVSGGIKIDINENCLKNLKEVIQNLSNLTNLPNFRKLIKKSDKGNFLILELVGYERYSKNREDIKSIRPKLRIRIIINGEECEAKYIPNKSNEEKILSLANKDKIEDTINLNLNFVVYYNKKGNHIKIESLHNEMK